MILNSLFCDKFSVSVYLTTKSTLWRHLRNNIFSHIENKHEHISKSLKNGQFTTLEAIIIRDNLILNISKFKFFRIRFSHCILNTQMFQWWFSILTIFNPFIILITIVTPVITEITSSYHSFLLSEWDAHKNGLLTTMRKQLKII